MRGDVAQETIPEPFILYTAQVVMDEMPHCKCALMMRFMAEVRATRAIKKGEPISFNDFDKIVAVELTDEDADAGHVTAIFLPKLHLLRSTFGTRQGGYKTQ